MGTNIFLPQYHLYKRRNERTRRQSTMLARHHFRIRSTLVTVCLLLFSWVVVVKSSRASYLSEQLIPSPTVSGWIRRRGRRRSASAAESPFPENPFSVVSEVAARPSSARRTKPEITKQQAPSSLSIPQRLISGGCSRGIAQVLLYPVDALRTLAQTRDGRTLADVGTRTLVRGCLTTSSFAFFIGSIQFAIFGATRSYCGPLVSSALGAAGSCVVSVPQEVIKQRLVTGVYPSFRSAVATIYRTEGVTGFYSGWRPTVARNVPFVVATFTAMDRLQQARLRQKAQQRNDDGNDKVSLTFAENLVIGISSSLIAGTITHPGKRIRQ